MEPILVSQVAQHGQKWSIIQKAMPGVTISAIRGRWARMNQPKGKNSCKICKRSIRGHTYSACKRSTITEQSNELKSDTFVLPSINMQIPSDASSLFEDVLLDLDHVPEVDPSSEIVSQDIFHEDALWMSDLYLMDQMWYFLEQMEEDEFKMQQQVKYMNLPRVEPSKKKKRRHKPSLYAKHHLIHAYNLNNGCMPSQQTRCDLAKAVDMTVRQVTYWFSNRRKRDTGK